MEQSQKKSFLLYFDNYPCLTALSDVQWGKLMLLLFRYAMEADRHPVEPESFIEQEPDLPPETRMAFLFVAQGIRRDTDRWRVKQQRYSEAARRREELAASRKEQENAEMIYYLNRFQEEHRAAEAGKQESGAQEADR